MASSILPQLLLTFTLIPTLFIPQVTSTAAATTINNSTAIKSLCDSTPYPSSCLDSSLISISIDPSSLLSFILRSLSAALSASSSLLPLLLSSHLDERQRGSIQDCRELHSSTISSLEISSRLLLRDSADVSVIDSRTLSDIRTHLSAALTNKNTCLEGLAAATGPRKDAVVESWVAAYRHVSNSLSLVSRSSGVRGREGKGRRLMRRRPPAPAWVKGEERRLLEGGDYGGYDPASILTVAADGSGNFTTIRDAIAFAPNMSDGRTIISISAGFYDENVEVPSYKTNIVLLGEGSDVTVIRGNRSMGDGWTTFRTATVAVAGQGFLARDLAFVNTAGPSKGQAVALRVNADLVAIYRCVIDGYQDTLYAHSFRQFYRDCDVYGTVDFIFGNAASVFQNCNIYSRLPKPGQANVITAQGRDDPNEATGFSIQNCSVLASDDLAAASNVLTRTYLGRPWRNYSTTVYIESYIDGVVDASGWSKWSRDDDPALYMLYYGEYLNDGPGAETGKRVDWPGFHLMGYDEARDFTVSRFIYGDQWLYSTSFPYDDGI